MTTHTRDFLKPAWTVSIFALAVLIGIFAAAIQLFTPPDEPNEIVDDDRLIEHINVIAAKPHPIGSEANAQVRDYVVGYLEDLGLDVEVQSDTVVYKHPRRERSATRIANVENIVAVLKGSAPADTIKTIALMSHYDSVPGAPGAGDAAAGVAAVLESALQLTRGTQPLNNVVFLITDGEEMGLLGAQAYFNQQPAAKTIDLVINFEARGSSGASLMFETSQGNAWIVSEAAESVPGLIANSLSYEIYQRMPNDTDVTISKAAGPQALNFAFIDSPSDYHASVDNATNLDRNTLRQHATNAVAATRHFAAVQDWAPPANDATYFNLTPGSMVQYGAVMEVVIALIVLLLCIVAIVRISSESSVSIRSVAYGLVVVVLLVVLVSNIFETWIDYYNKTPGSWIRLASQGIEPFAAYALIAAGVSIWLLSRLATGMGTVAALLPFGLLLIVCILTGRTHPALFAALIPAMLGLWWLRGRVNQQALVVASLVIWSLICALLLWQMPKGAYIGLWPLGSVALAIGVATFIPSNSTLARVFVLLIGCVIPLLILAPTAHLFYLSLGIGMPQLPMMLVSLVVVLLMPLTLATGGTARGACGLVMMVAGAGLLWSSISTEWPTERHPVPESLFFAVDADRGEGYWASTDSEPSDWIRNVLGEELREREMGSIMPNSKSKYWAGSTEQYPALALQIGLLTDEVVADRRRVKFHLRSPQQAEYLSLFLPAGLTYYEARVNGREVPVPSDQKSEWRWRWYGLPEAGGTVELLVAPGKPLKLYAVEVAYNHPEPTPPRPVNSQTHPYRWSDATVTYQAIAVADATPSNTSDSP